MQATGKASRYVDKLFRLSKPGSDLHSEVVIPVRHVRQQARHTRVLLGSYVVEHALYLQVSLLRKRLVLSMQCGSMITRCFNPRVPCQNMRETPRAAECQTTLISSQSVRLANVLYLTDSYCS